MQITLITGGARSGKSAYAQRLAAHLGGDAVSVIATARAVDDDMRQRIAHHRAERPAAWEVIEAPVEAERALAAAQNGVVILDCLTVLSANVLMRSGPRTRSTAEDAITRQSRAIIDSAATRAGMLVVVTNEVGSSVHPVSELGRWYQDGLGKANALLAASAETVLMMVCGLPLALKGVVPVT